MIFLLKHCIQLDAKVYKQIKSVFTCALFNVCKHFVGMMRAIICKCFPVVFKLKWMSLKGAKLVLLE